MRHIDGAGSIAPSRLQPAQLVNDCRNISIVDLRE